MTEPAMTGLLALQCHPRTPSSAEMRVILDTGAVERFSEVFFQGAGLASQKDLVTTFGHFDPKLVKMAPSGERPED
jgi:hypothetical protein